MCVYTVERSLLYMKGFNVIVPLFRGDQLNISHQVLYHIMTLLKSCTEKSFEIVLDMTQATQLNEPDVSCY